MIRLPLVRRRVLAILLATIALPILFLIVPNPTLPPTISTLRLDGNPSFPLAFSPDNATLATFDDQRTLTFWDVPTGRPLRRLPEKTLARALVFSPDGRSFAYNREYAPGIKDGARVVRTHDFAPLLDVDGPLHGDLRFSPDGAAFHLVTLRFDKPPHASHVLDGQVRSWCTADWHENPPRPFLPRPNGLLAFSPDAHTLASADDRRPDVLLHDVDRPDPVATLADPANTAFNSAIAFSPDGALLAVGKADGVVELWHVPTRRLLAKPRLHSPGLEPKRLLVTASPPALISNAPYLGPATWPMFLQRRLAQILPNPNSSRGPFDCVLYDINSQTIRQRLHNEAVTVTSPDGALGASPTRDGRLLRIRDLKPH